MTERDVKYLAMEAKLRASAEEAARMAESLAPGVAGRIARKNGLFGAPYGTHTDHSGKMSSTSSLPKPGVYTTRMGPVSALIVPTVICPECLSQLRGDVIDQLRIRFYHNAHATCSNSMTEFTRSIGEFIQII